MRIRISKHAGETCLVAISLCVCLAAIELTMQAHRAWQRRQLAVQRNQAAGEPLHVKVDTPELYGLNPRHPEVSDQGLRNAEVIVPKPRNRRRILILGDSVTFGTKVSMQEAYPARLQEILASRLGDVEVINAGVSGYSPYNQLQFYKTRGRDFEPDVVVVGFCMNDVANPRHHWDNTGDFIEQIPNDAIPNHEYDRKLASQRRSMINRSVLYGAVQRRAARLLRGESGDDGVPTFITGEDTISIEVLLDEGSPEWRWLTSMYNQLHDAVVADGAELVIVIFPLSYQLDPGYPHLPQERLAEYCRSRSITWLDLLPRFRADPHGGHFLEKYDGTRDAWHLSERGHQLTALLLAELLHRP